MTEQTKENMALVVLAVIVIGFIAVVFKATDTPDVIFSYSTKKCVKVINADGTAGDCNHLPERYNHIWGK